MFILVLSAKHEVSFLIWYRADTTKYHKPERRVIKKIFLSIFFLKEAKASFFIWEMLVHSTFSLILHFIYARKKTRKILSVSKNSHIYRPEARNVHSRNRNTVLCK